MSTIWPRFNALMLVLVFLALLSLIAMVAMRAEGGPLDPSDPPGSTDAVRLPSTPINAPTVISVPGHYYLTGDIKVSGPMTGITIASRPRANAAAKSSAIRRRACMARP